MHKNNEKQIKPVKIVVAGMPQGGTTALYNMVNFIFRLNDLNIGNFLYHPTECHWPMNDLMVERSKEVAVQHMSQEDYDKFVATLELARNRSATINEENLRIISKAHDAGEHEGWWVEDAEHSRMASAPGGNSCYLVKEHHYNSFLCDEWADIIFVMRRDIRDSIASRRRRGKPLISKALKMEGLHTYDPETFDGFKEWCEHITKDCYQSWVDKAKEEKKSLYCLDYIEYKKDPHKIIKEVYHKITDKYKHDLSMPSPEDLMEVLNNLHLLPKMISFFTPAMMTNAGSEQAYKELLSSKELDFIEREYSDWINK
jgi:hypothetical protein